MLIVILSLISVIHVQLLPHAHCYYGRHSTEAILRFDGRADITLPEYVTLELLNSQTDQRREALKQLREQIRHLMGTFQSDSFKQDFGYLGALGEKSLINFKAIANGSESGRVLVDYEFKGLVVFQKEAFGGHKSVRVPVKLPLASDKIYSAGLKRTKNGYVNLCTDRESNEQSDFWYYWDPDQDGCPLQGNDHDVFRTTGLLEIVPNTKVSYPNYDRLYGDNGNGDALDIALLLGFIRYQDTEKNRPSRRDEALKAFRFIDKDLKDRGFELLEKKTHFRINKDGSEQEGINILRRYEKEISRGEESLRIRVFTLLADTDIDSKDFTFRSYLAKAMRESDIVIYDGHSNLGRNFDLNSLPEVTFDPSKYQIFFFNGCSTYPFLNDMYFRAKAGPENVNIITAGLPAFASASGPNVVTFLDNFLEGKTLSYQKILSDLEKSNGDVGTFLVGVKGDEASHWHP